MTSQEITCTWQESQKEIKAPLCSQFWFKLSFPQSLTCITSSSMEDINLHARWDEYFQSYHCHSSPRKNKKQLLKGPHFQCLWPGREEGNNARCMDNSEKINKYVVTLTSVNNSLIQNRIVCLSV